jgi:asparagine synthase (glutamine-hydrolysing)
MCGIVGVFHYRDQGRPDPGLLERQAAMLRHRGPDDSGLWCEGPVALGHRRLSIVDLSPGGRQPMPNEDETLWVTYNGELYGWPETRSVLAARGHRFRGTSDTEALLHLYEEHGDGLLEHLRGMFAFALYDRRARRMLLARDRLGIKPLYWHDDGKRLVFASELKALLLDPTVPREVDPTAVADYLTFQYVPSPRTIWQGVRKLAPGHALTCDAGGVVVRRYWALPVEPDPGHPVDYYRERLRALLAEAVRLRLVADVPLGAFLSGGIDSSAVVAFMTEAVSEPIKTFTIGFEEEDASELEHAARVARHLGTDHRERVVRPEALSLLPRLVWQCDEPFADASIIPTYYVSEMARREVTVALSGDGGDEAFAGYVTYPWARRYAGLDGVPVSLRRLAATAARALPDDHLWERRLRRFGLDVLERHLEAMSFFPRRDLARILAPELAAATRGHDPYAAHREHHGRAAAAAGDLPALLYLDAMTYMADGVLQKVDRASMLSSLEVRVPLLDHKVLEFVARIPFEHKLRGEVGKWILRESVRDLLPAPTLARGKQGFGMPLERWFRGDFGRLAREVLLDPRARGRGWIDPAAVERLLGSQRDDRGARQIWALLCLELWARTYCDRPREQLATPLPPAALGAVARAAAAA